jgi:formate dehydrogenase iron-sulfur subunit
MNADEGDPGAYIDRILLEEDPHATLEGLAIAGHAVGATRGFIYLRREYPDAFLRLRTAIAEAQSAGLLGDGARGCGPRFDVEVVIGEGSYVCGEETALLNSIEGVRPFVRSRPPYPSDKGLFGAPTLVNNVETLANLPWIIEHGARRLQTEVGRRVADLQLSGLSLHSHRKGCCQPNRHQCAHARSSRAESPSPGGAATCPPALSG